MSARDKFVRTSGGGIARRQREKETEDLRMEETSRSGEELRASSAHSHVMSHHALSVGTPEADEAAAQAHEVVAKKHRERASAKR